MSIGSNALEEAIACRIVDVGELDRARYRLGATVADWEEARE